MNEVSNSNKTIADSQSIRFRKKLKKVFGHLDNKNPPDICPVRDILSVASDKWSILIILNLGGYKVLRFNELRKILYGISSKTLSDKLKTLEIDGYINREQFPEVPIRVEYTLTQFGLNYAEKLLELTEWMELQSVEIVKRRIDNKVHDA